MEIINHSAYPKDDPELSASFIENFEFEKREAREDIIKAQEI